ncbi:hypothetical protein, partial [Laribacter hongkongensis]|uniref:hypothetical protein n=1 Tax=Laribacter hongkongensis TaxID=168471 RepID=UPI001D0CA2E8
SNRTRIHAAKNVAKVAQNLGTGRLQHDAKCPAKKGQKPRRVTDTSKRTNRHAGMLVRIMARHDTNKNPRSQ